MPRVRPASNRHALFFATKPVRRPAAAKALDAVRETAEDCRACPLWANATQTVFGEGPPGAAIMLVGEQPGDREDIAGRPFVGPAGRLLDRALAEAGIQRSGVYVTNAVKHFKNEPRGKRRIHKKPADTEIDACHQWLERELKLVAPRLIVALGATAARAVLGRATPIEPNRGRLMRIAEGPNALVTVHPSFLLRLPDKYRADAYRRFVDDLRIAVQYQQSEH
jgi:uracil-DNA glycosylase